MDSLRNRPVAVPSRLALVLVAAWPATIFAQVAPPGSNGGPDAGRGRLLVATQERTADPDGAEASSEPSSQQSDLNERYPNVARPPWTGPEPQYSWRPGYDERYLYPRLRFRSGDTAYGYGDGYRYSRSGYLNFSYGWYGAYSPGRFAAAFGDAYFAGRAAERDYQAHRFNILDMNRRQERNLTAHEKALKQGIELMRSGEHSRAVIALTMAGELDQGDPACRIHLALARLALGQYEQAGRAVHRALQLQPKLVYADLHLDRYFPTAEAFEQAADRLALRVSSVSAAAHAVFLMGFIEFQRGNFGPANQAFRRLAAAGREDDLVQAYLAVTLPPTERDGRDLAGADLLGAGGMIRAARTASASPP